MAECVPAVEDGGLPEDKEELEGRLKTLDCPPNWPKVEMAREVSVKESVLLKQQENTDVPYSMFVYSLVLAYDSWTNDEYSESEQHLDKCAAMLDSNKDNEVVRFKIGLKNVIDSFKAFIYFRQSKFEKTRELLDTIIKTSKLSNVDQAALMALKCSILSEYGIEGSIAGLEWARKASTLAPSEGLFHFLVGKMMTRKRHMVNNKCPSDDEIHSFKQSFKLSKTADAAVYLASAYAELAKSLYLEIPVDQKKSVLQTSTGVKIKTLCDDAKKLFLEAIELNGDRNCHVIVRCGRGLTQLPGKFKDLELAVDLIKRALKISPTNTMALHYYAIHLMLQNKHAEAVEHLKLASDRFCYGASVSLIEVSYKLDRRNFDVLEAYEDVLRRYPTKTERANTHLLLLLYYILVEGDLFEALFHFKRAYELDKYHGGFKWCPANWFNKTVFVNICKLVCNEVRLVLNKRQYNDREEKRELEDVLELVASIAPEEIRVQTRSDMVTSLRQIGKGKWVRPHGARGGRARGAPGQYNQSDRQQPKVTRRQGNKEGRNAEGQGREE